MALAFLPVPPAATTETPVESKPTMPTFKPRWWYKHDRIDVRPVIWSLQNRPEEWAIETIGSQHSYDTWFTVRHAPSKHKFMRHSTGTAALMAENVCSCNRAQFQVFHAGALGRALQEWRKRYAPITPINSQFASHFMT